MTLIDTILGNGYGYGVYFESHGAIVLLSKFLACT